MPPSSGVALCLSGGGFRSALFHLGALRRLKELRVLHRVELISSVSGGSILAGFLADLMASDGGLGSRPGFERWLDRIDWEEHVASPFREITSHDFRTLPVLQNLLWNWAIPGPRVAALEKRYRRRVSGRALGELPEHPTFVICATNLAFGVNWIFTRERAGDYQAGYVDARSWPLARAIAASSCFPPIFGPMSVRVPFELYKGGDYRGENREWLLSRTQLTDGGVYDNLGLEPAWKEFACVLVSDCGAPFEFSVGKEPLRRLLRYTSVVMNQASSVRKRMYFAQKYAGRYTGTYWGIRSASDKRTEGELAALSSNEEPEERGTAEPSDGGYRRELVDESIAEIRTDLDAFTDAEQRVLENHGYFAANRSIARYLAAPPVTPAPLSPPHPDWLDENKVRQALRDSHRRVSLRRWFQIHRQRRQRR
jgi:NTE family protein